MLNPSPRPRAPRRRALRLLRPSRRASRGRFSPLRAPRGRWMRSGTPPTSRGTARDLGGRDRSRKVREAVVDHDDVGTKLGAADAADDRRRSPTTSTSSRDPGRTRACRDRRRCRPREALAWVAYAGTVTRRPRAAGSAAARRRAPRPRRQDASARPLAGARRGQARLAGQDAERPALALEHAFDDLERDASRIVVRGHSRPVDEPEVRALADRDAVELRVARRHGTSPVATDPTASSMSASFSAGEFVGM